jgi:predicted nucleic acid-binding protein
MTNERIFLDTVFVQALLNRRDQYHSRAKALMDRVRGASDIFVTEAILVEIGNALASINREGAVSFIKSCYSTPNVNVVLVDTFLLNKALNLYENRADKEWGLTDCISFVVMEEQNISFVLSTDIHFRQAGFTPLL